MSQDKESNERVLELEAKHHLHGKSDQEVGDLMQSMSNGELVALLKDFKVPYNHNRKRLKEWAAQSFLANHQFSWQTSETSSTYF